VKKGQILSLEEGRRFLCRIVYTFSGKEVLKKNIMVNHVDVQHAEDYVKDSVGHAEQALLKHKDEVIAAVKADPAGAREAINPEVQALRYAQANPYGFPLSATGIPIVQGMDSNKVLGSHDIVGVTFWIACAAMLAGSVFFFTERASVPARWQTSVTVAGLVTGVAFWNYCYMRESWVRTQNSPTVYRYTDWLITVPLQIVEFYLIIKAVQPATSVSVFWRLLGMSTLMLLFGWAGETGIVSVLCGFVPGVLCWLALVYEFFSGETAGLAAGAGSKATANAFNTMRMIVAVGWAIYPLGYYLTLLGPTVTYHDQSVINVVYNIADLVNKLAFGLCIWGAAITDK
jgi:bacteriorhodopsin